MIFVLNFILWYNKGPGPADFFYFFPQALDFPKFHAELLIVRVLCLQII
jgi:hypothetical protein